MRKSDTLIAAAISAAMMLGAGPALADVVYSTGFEPAAYTTGALAGQNGWSGGGGTVETSTVFTGTQAVEYDASGLSAGQYISLVSVPVSGQGPLMQVSVEFYVSAADPNILWDAIGVDGNNGFIGQIIVDDGDALGGTNGSVSVPVTVDAWNSYVMDFDFATDTQTAYVNGVFDGTAAFASGNTSVAFVGFGINATLGSATSQAYADNLSVEAVPEPTSIALLGGRRAGE